VNAVSQALFNAGPAPGSGSEDLEKALRIYALLFAVGGADEETLWFPPLALLRLEALLRSVEDRAG